MQEETKWSISIPSSSRITRDIVDQRAKQLGLDRSSYTHQLYEMDIFPKKYDKIKNVIDLIIMLLGFAVIILILLVVK